MGTPIPVKVISLRVRPSQVSHLSFEVDGVVEQLSAQLGASVTPFNFTTFYGSLSNTVSGSPSRLVYDSLGIQTATSVQASTLLALRAESTKAVLDKAVNARQNAYYAKYANASGIASKMNDYYSLTKSTAKPARLATLASLASQQANDLQSAYTHDKRTAVVKTTSSQLISTTSTIGTSAGGSQQSQKAIDGTYGSGTWGPPPAAGQPFSGISAGGDPGSFEEGSTFDTSTSQGVAEQSQTITNTDYGYRVPYIESQAQNERAQISLMDQQFAQYMYGQNLAYLTQVFANELQSIDLDVKRLQVAYLNTIMMSPIAGVVTGIYKNLGDSVRAGDPILRVEDNSAVILVGTLIYPGLISIGSSVTVETSLFDSATPASITGDVVAVRGHRSEDDQWDVLVSCTNMSGGKPIFPLNYYFDYDDTTVTIS